MLRRLLFVLAALLSVACGSRLAAPRLRAVCASLLPSLVIGVQCVFAAPATVVDANDLNRLRLGLREVSYLVDHWEEKTTYCNFGELTNDLLAVDNKEKLYEEAKKGSLWEKSESTMNIKCKRDPQVVRAFVGLTDDNLLLRGVDRLLHKPSTLDRLGEDDQERYEADADAYLSALGEVDQLSYAARTDHDSTETFSKADGRSIRSEAGTDYLSQTKVAVGKLRDALSGLIKDLQLE